MNTERGSNWTVLERFRGCLGSAPYKRNLVRVRCTCGYEGVRREDHVRDGKSVECRQCSSKKVLRSIPEHGWLTHNRQYCGDLGSTFFCHIRNGAAKRGLDFAVTQAFLWELFTAQGGLCALTGWPITLSTKISGSNPDYSSFDASLDRIDNTKGYVEGNVQWVHKEINRLKNNYSVEHLLSMCKALVAYAEAAAVENANTACKSGVCGI